MHVNDIPRRPNREGDPTEAPWRWMYVAPDGGRHYLFTLPGRDNGTTVKLEFPSGAVHEFKTTGDFAGTDFCESVHLHPEQSGQVCGSDRDVHGNSSARSSGHDGTRETENDVLCFERFHGRSCSGDGRGKRI